jgi:hypothetical protein
MTEGRGRPSRSSLCVCCGVRADLSMVFPRSAPRPDLPDVEVPICAECRKLVGRRRFKSIPTMRDFVPGHLARRHEAFQVPPTEDIATLPTRGMQRAAAALIRYMERLNAQRERRLSFDPNARKRAS